jgi:hypothetical protein
MTQAQNTTHATTSIMPLALAALAAAAALGVALIVTQADLPTFELGAAEPAPAPAAVVRSADSWQAQRLAVSGATYESPLFRSERAWEQQRLAVSGAIYGSGAINPAEEAWEHQHLPTGTTVAPVAGDVFDNLHSEYLIDMFRRQAAGDRAVVAPTIR